MPSGTTKPRTIRIRPDATLLDTNRHAKGRRFNGVTPPDATQYGTVGRNKVQLDTARSRLISVLRNDPRRSHPTRHHPGQSENDLTRHYSTRMGVRGNRDVWRGPSGWISAKTLTRRRHFKRVQRPKTPFKMGAKFF